MRTDTKCPYLVNRETSETPYQGEGLLYNALTVLIQIKNTVLVSILEESNTNVKPDSHKNQLSTGELESVLLSQRLIGGYEGKQNSIILTL